MNRHNIILAGALAWLMPLCTMNAQEPADSAEMVEVYTPSWGERLYNNLTLLAQEADRNYYNTGMSVYDLTTDSLIFAYNQHKMMRPASTQKVLTAIAALDLLGAGHEYATNVYAKGTLADGQLTGDLYVVGDFDPMLTAEHLRQIASEVKTAGINSISGRLLADVSMKDTLCLGNGWCWDDEQPFLTPLSLSGKAYECANFKINRYNPSDNFMKALADAFKAEGIDVGGIGTATYRADKNGWTICSITHTLCEILKPMMKDSDNLMAESMFFQLGAEKKRGAGWKDCASQVEAVITNAGMPTSLAVVADGCGLSLYNYITPGLQVAMLRNAYQKEAIFGPLYHSMPIAGVDGTLQSRMRKTKAENNVHAKTGSVTGVSTLTGYLTASNGHLIAFSIMCNGQKKASEARAFQDRICEAMCE